MKSSGNGVATYTESSTQKETKIRSIDNKGMITGEAIIYGGKSKKSAEDTTLRDKRFHVDIDEKSFEKEDVDFLKQENTEWNKYENEREIKKEMKKKTR